MNENYQTMAIILMLEMGSVSESSILTETGEFDYFKPVVQPRLCLSSAVIPGQTTTLLVSSQL